MYTYIHTNTAIQVSNGNNFKSKRSTAPHEMKGGNDIHDTKQDMGINGTRDDQMYVRTCILHTYS